MQEVVWGLNVKAAAAEEEEVEKSSSSEYHLKDN